MIDVGVSIGGSVNEMVRLDCKISVPPKWTLSDADIVCLQVSNEMHLLAKVQANLFVSCLKRSALILTQSNLRSEDFMRR